MELRSQTQGKRLGTRRKPQKIKKKNSLESEVGSGQAIFSDAGTRHDEVALWVWDRR